MEEDDLYARTDSSGGSIYYCSQCNDWFERRHIHCPKCGEKIEVE